MRKISVKQLYHHLSKELKDLPFAITKNGAVVAVVGSPDGLDNQERSRPKIVELSRPEKKKSRPASKIPDVPNHTFVPYSKDRQLGKKGSKSG